MIALTAPLNAALMIVMPIVLAVVLRRRLGVRGALFGAGALTFVASQVVHIPLNIGIGWVFQQGLLPPPPEWRMAFNLVVLGLTSGLSEETARYIAFRRFLPKVATWREGMMFGAGHGGIEAILLGVAVLINFAAFYTLRESGYAGIPPESLEQTRQAVEVFWATPPLMAFLGGVERVFAICLHLALSLLVLTGVVRRAPVLWLAAVLWHATVNGVAVGIAQTVGAVEAEVALAFLTIPAIALIVGLRRELDESPRTGTAVL